MVFTYTDLISTRLSCTPVPRYVVACFLQRQVWSGCSGSGDYVELLGGNGVDTSKMFPVADLCFSLSGLGESETLQLTSRTCELVIFIFRYRAQ